MQTHGTEATEDITMAQTSQDSAFRTHPRRAAFEAEWNSRVARGEDPKQGLVNKVESTPTSSFIEYWWRKATKQEKTKMMEKQEQAMRAERGASYGVQPHAVDPRPAESYGEWERQNKKIKWHDKLRWGL